MIPKLENVRKIHGIRRKTIESGGEVGEEKYKYLNSSEIRDINKYKIEKMYRKSVFENSLCTPVEAKWPAQG